MALYVPPTEESDHKKQNMSLQLIGGQTSTNTTAIATNTAAIATLNAATYVNSVAGRTGVLTLNTASGITNSGNDVLISPASTSQFGAVKVAAKTDQTTATSTTLAVTPSVQQFHPSAVKAWVVFTASTAAVLASYNVTSVSRTSAGTYVVTFTTGFTSANYVCHVTTENNGGSGSGAQVASGGRATGTVTVITFNTTTLTLTDPTSVMVSCFGTQ